MSVVYSFYLKIKNRSLPANRAGLIETLCANIPLIRAIEAEVREEAVRYFTRVDDGVSLPADKDARDEFDALAWWQNNANAGDLLSLKQALAVSLLYHPTSAAAERVFSLVNNYLGKKHMAAGDQFMRAQVMTQYNESFKTTRRAVEAQKYSDVWNGVLSFLGQREAALELAELRLAQE